MTTDLSNKTVEQLIDWGTLDLSGLYLLEACHELASRLETAQKRNAAHDAKIVAEAKAEAMEELRYYCIEYHVPFPEAVVSRGIDRHRSEAAEYRAEAGRKE